MLPTRLASSAASSAARPTSISRVAVIGAGQMGLGIAYVSAVHARCAVSICDASATQLQRGVDFFRALLDKDVKKGRMSGGEAEGALRRLRTVEGVPALAGGDMPQLVVEAVTERLAVKQEVFRKLAETLPLETILATNTSSISVSKIAAAAGDVSPRSSASASSDAGDPDPAAWKRASAARCLGLHFMNPVPVLKLVELIPALQTSPSVTAAATAFAQACDKTVVTSRDTPAFIANRLLMPYINEAVLALSEGVASREDIDATMRLGMSHPMGPLALADFIGLDTCLYIMETMYRETGDSKYRPAVLLGRMVDAGWVGKKGGKGFYNYTP